MFSVRVDRRNDEGLIEITPVADSVSFSTAALGGFSSCSFSCRLQDYKRIPHLAHVRLTWNDRVLWEGRVEDKNIVINEQGVSCLIDCYGFMKMLEEYSVRKIWSLRSIPWRPNFAVTGLSAVGAVTPVVPNLDGATMFVSVGQFDPTDLSRVGLDCDNVSGVGPGSGDAAWAVYVPPEGVSINRLMCTAATYGTTPWAFIQQSVDAVTWTELYEDNAPTYPGVDLDLAVDTTTRYLILGSMYKGGGSRTTYENIRILGSELTEDLPGGFFGGNLVRDLMRLVPGLNVGTIDAGQDFVVSALARTARDSAMSVLQEISSFYDNEWGVWEDRKFSWKGVSLDEPHWVIALNKVTEIDLRSSVEGLAKTVYMLFDDAASGEGGESSEDSSDERNPYTRYEDRSDMLLTAPSVMLSNSADRLAQKVVRDRGGAPVATGRMVLPAKAEVSHADGSRGLAMFLRGGDNVLIPDLPTDHYFRPSPGGDGQTMFHIRATETDMASGRTSIELDAFAHTSDVIMARVAAVTRILQGS